MQWNIPDLQDRPYPCLPKIQTFLGFTVLIMTGFFLSGYFYFHYRTFEEYLDYCWIPASWAVFLPFMIIQCYNWVLGWLIRSDNKKRANQRQKMKRWGKKQFLVLGNVLFTPEQEDIPSLFQKENILESEPKSLGMSFQTILKKIKKQLEDHYASYEKHLEKIYLVIPEDLQGNNSECYKNLVTEQWNIPIEYIHDMGKAINLFDVEKMESKLVMILSLQLWDDEQEKSNITYSEFACAQLICPEYFHDLGWFKPETVYGYVGRFMQTKADNLNEDISHFIEYGISDSSKTISLLGSNITETLQDKMIQQFHSQNYPVTIKNIEQGLGNLGSLASLINIAIVLEMVKNKQEPLLFAASQNDDVFISMISDKAF